ncbi:MULTISPECIES: helix-turn-helix domain-containing protein [unclassified Brevundimonas]|uniref:helix-turn-helix domain-containing protein n=1 Tax=unclassified Brevundimonas TaxID=2622653 RepID=UPI0025C1259C|nr:MULTISPECIES: helix-turn-helix transcriptional regulator [unclassified Brevundimonas]
MARQVLEVDVMVGRAVAQRRQHQGLSQSALAQQLGISFQQVQKYEAGQNRLSAGRLFQLSQILNCPVGAFFPSSERDEPLPGSHRVYSMEARQLVRSFNRIEDRALRRSISRIAEALAPSA